MKISFIGAGHITELLINHLTNTSQSIAEKITIADPNAVRCAELKEKFGVRVARNNREAVLQSDFIFVCVQPSIVERVVCDLKETSLDNKILISVSAGISISTYQKELPGAVVARVLPNPPSAVGEGAIPITISGNVQEAQLKNIMELLNLFGKCFAVSEDKIDIFTSLTSPAPVLSFFESMIDASVLCGLDYKTSSAMVFQTIFGCLKLWEENDLDLHPLIIKSCTPAGTSVESLRVMDQMNFRAAVKESYRAAWEKSKSFNNKNHSAGL
ncbi:MAG: pyrroline-5-carboxylate reductase [Cloacibacillus sp.]